jgi:hypothetical protein
MGKKDFLITSLLKLLFSMNLKFCDINENFVNDERVFINFRQLISDKKKYFSKVVQERKDYFFCLNTRDGNFFKKNLIFKNFWMILKF